MTAAPQRQVAQLHAADVCAVSMVTWKLPPAGVNITGTPAHVLKVMRAASEAGVRVNLLEVDLGTAHRLGFLARELRNAWRALTATRPDVLHCHGHIVTAAFLPMARALRIPVICEIHGLYVPSRPGQAHARPRLSRLARALEKPVLTRCDHVIAQAQQMRTRLVRLGVAPERITVLYPGLRTREFSEYDGPPAVLPEGASDERVVMYVGSTQGYQGLDLLAKSQPLWPERTRVVLVLSGGAGTREDVVARFGFLPGSTSVVEPSGSAGLPAWTRMADVLVHARPDCPDNVNVQSKLGLYLASGAPVVATNVGDYPRLLGASPGCILTDPDPRSFARGIRAALSLPPEALAEARSANQRLAEEHFESAANARKLVGIYERLRSSASAPTTRGPTISVGPPDSRP